MTGPAPTDFSKERMFPELPYDAWKATKNTLHLYSQIVGKVRLALFPPVNHWWGVTLYVSPRGLTTRAIPWHYGSFEMELDFIGHQLTIAASNGSRRHFPLFDGLSVSQFYDNVKSNLSALGIEPHVRPVPYDTMSKVPFKVDQEHAAYDKEYVERFQRVLVGIDGIFEEFRARFTGKSSPVHVFWHSFDIAMSRYSGRRAPTRAEANPVEREAYSHEYMGFGFWAGDERTTSASFYAYEAPAPAGLSEEPLRPAAASWGDVGGGAIALLPYDEVRRADSPREVLLDFLESAYQAGAKRANWDIEGFTHRPA